MQSPWSKFVTLMRHPWLLSIKLGIILALLTLFYVASPGKAAYDPDRPQLYSPPPALQITKSEAGRKNDVTHPELCAAVITDDLRGFPMAMLERFGPDSCTGNRYIHILGIIFNAMFYTFIVRGIIALWSKYGQKFIRRLRREPGTTTEQS